MRMPQRALFESAVARLKINDILQLLPVEVGGQVAGAQMDNPFHRLRQVVDPGDMGCDIGVGKGPQGMFRREGFRIHHIQGDPQQPALCQCVTEGLGCLLYTSRCV